MEPALPLILVVIDGWGIALPGPHNGIALAKPSTMERLARDYPSTTLEAAGPAVGLPEGQMGNSEVGHLNIGAGRIVDQDFVRINKAVEAGRLADNVVLREAFARCQADGSALHLMGLLGPGGVHSHERHLFGLLDAAKKHGVARIWIHHFLDGRDTPPQSALDFAKRAQTRIDAIGAGRVATVSGRYWSMDRDKRWERTARSYRMLTELEGHRAPTAVAAIEAAYARGETDEFVEPIIVDTPDPLRDGDAVVVYNFRPDRARQIVRALADPEFRDFPTKRRELGIVTMTQYDRTFEALGVKVAFPPAHPLKTLGELYADLGRRQLRIAETEKYAHVTYFFSGGREAPFAGEDRILIPSPKVATYDQKPEMSAREITDALTARLTREPCDLVVLNFANPDMVGHTGLLDPTIAAVRTVDDCIARLHAFAIAHGYVLAITADHGNAEAMVDPEGRPRTSHTTNPVPFLVVHERVRGRRMRPGILADVAPTLLDVVGLRPPAEMTGRALWDVVPTGSRPK